MEITIIILSVVICVLIFIIGNRVGRINPLNRRITLLNDLLSKQEEKLKEVMVENYKNVPIVKLFEEPKDRISYSDWYSNKYGDKTRNTKVFNEYWDEVCRNEYYAWHVRKISRYPDFLVNLISEIKKFDFEKVSDYMKSVNWTWNDRKESPTIEQMIDCVFSLAENLNGQDDKDGCSSGGFLVKRMTGDKAEITFTFNYHG